MTKFAFTSQEFAKTIRHDHLAVEPFITLRVKPFAWQCRHEDTGQAATPPSDQGNAPKYHFATAPLLSGSSWITFLNCTTAACCQRSR